MPGGTELEVNYKVKIFPLSSKMNEASFIPQKAGEGKNPSPQAVGLLSPDLS